MWNFSSFPLIVLSIALSHHDKAVIPRLWPSFPNVKVMAFDTSSLLRHNWICCQESWRFRGNTHVSQSTISQVEFCNRNVVGDKGRIFREKNDTSVVLSLPDRNEEKDKVQVEIVSNNQDISSLADLRYKEWIQSPTDDDKNNSQASSSWVPSLPSFRRATAEIFFERKREGSQVFLAKITNTDCVNETRIVADSLVVGAAELSPIEMQGAIVEGQSTNKDDTSKCTGQPLYITDVVTSSEFRRRGIGSALMNAMEKAAWEMGAPCVFLHVEQDNSRARKFYQRLGYICIDATEKASDRRYEKEEMKEAILSISLEDGNIRLNPPMPDEGKTVCIDMLRLSVNAGAMGQLLLAKGLAHQMSEKVKPVLSAPLDSS